MPTPTENLLKAFYQPKFEEVIGFIKTDAELVNAVDAKFGCSLLQLALEGSKPDDETQALITFIVTHPKFNIAYKKPEDETNLASIISSARTDVVGLVIKDPKILFNESQLTYAFAKEKLVLAEHALQRDVKKNPDSKSSVRGKTKVAQLKEMVSMLRDATILHAMATDNADLLTQLDKAGGEPTDFLGKLGNGKLPNMLVTKENTNIRAWFKKGFDKSLEVLAKSSLSLLASVKSAKDEIDEKQSQLATLDKGYFAKRTAIQQRAIASMSERADAIVAVAAMS